MEREAPLLPSRFRRPTKGWRLVSVAFPVGALLVASMYIFYWGIPGFTLLECGYLLLLVAFFLPLCFMWLPATQKAPRDKLPWYDIILVLLSTAIPFYFFSHQMDIMLAGWSMTAPPTAVALGFILWLIVLEGGRRAAGPIFTALVLVLSFYPLFGHYLPGFLWAPPFPFSVVVNFHIMSEESLIGTIMRVLGRLFLGYMFFAIVLQMLGAGKFFTDLAMALVGKTRAGNAKVAIFASGLFGSISGDAISNVFVTGAFTIPAMKKEGMPAHYAGAVEACASSGGVLMPPIMGAVAFIMAEFLEMAYTEIVIAAAVPALLYYVCLFAQIDSYAARVGLRPAPITVEVPPIWRTLINNFHIILGFTLLIVLLFVFRMIAQGPWYGAMLTIVLAVFRKETRLHLRRLVVGFWEEFGRILGELVAILAPVGMILGGFILTGLSYSLPNVIVSMAGGNVWIMLFMGALASLILGMGVTVSACYIFLAIVLAPGMVEAGFDLLAAHLFVLYCGTLSYITPPVALAAFAGATVAESAPMKTGFTAMRLGIAKYIVPFIFILSPALILRGSASEILLAVPAAFVGIIVLSGAMEGYFWRVGTLTIVTRILLFGAGILIAIPGVSTDLYGVGIIAAIVGLAYLLRGRSPLYKVLVHQTQSKTDSKQT